jgi:hypothetical protein
MSREREPLAVKSNSTPLVLDYNEVAATLIDVLRQHHRVMDPNTYEILEPELVLIAELLADEFSPVSVWNCMNSTLGQGILLGHLSESVQNYYTMLEERTAQDNDVEETDDEN